jgi:hypothetical protein
LFHDFPPQIDRPPYCKAFFQSNWRLDGNDGGMLSVMRFKSKHLATGPKNDAGVVKPEHILIA